jgi:hypothetical protein
MNIDRGIPYLLQGRFPIVSVLESAYSALWQCRILNTKMQKKLYQLLDINMT